MARRFHPSLHDRVRSGRPEWCSYLLDAEVPQSAIEHRTIARVAVVNQKSRRPPIPSAAFHYLLGRPLRRRMGGYRDVQDFPVHVADYKRHRASETGLFGRRRNRTPICSIHGASRIFANPRMGLECVANSYTLRQSSQKP